MDRALIRHKMKKKMSEENWRATPKHNKKTLEEPESHVGYKRQVNLNNYP